MSNETLILFGGFILLLFMRKSRIKSRRRTKGFVQVLVLLIDAAVLMIGISTLTIGLIRYLR